MDIDTLRFFWFIVIGILLAGYSILDGFDLGVGCLFPFLTKTDKEKQTLLNSISPFWDGNEVWLLTGGGALFAAFPHAYATIFSGFYLALMIVLFALIFRAVSIEFHKYDSERKRFWHWAFIIGSFVPSLLFGVALGNVIVGVPLNERLDFAGNFFTLLRPYPLLIGIFGLVVIIYHGANFIVLKTTGDLRDRALKILPKLRIAFALLLFAGFLISIPYNPQALVKPLSWVFWFIVVISLIMNSIYIKNGKEWKAFMMSCVSFFGLWGMVGSIHFPNLVKGIPSSERILGEVSLTIFNSSSSLLTLKVMALIAIIGMPIVIGYKIFVYRIFREKISPDDEGYY